MPMIRCHSFALALATFVAAQEAPRQDASPTLQGAVVRPVQIYKNADELLTALETADADLKSLTADIKYDKTDGIAGDRQERRGKLYFEDKGDADETAGKRDRTFSIRFDELRQGDRVEKESKLYIFDGEWFTEINPKFKQVLKRQVVPPGEKFDPLRIGEGPLPLPIGQKKADIAQRFFGELLNESAGLDGMSQADRTKLLEFVKGAYQLRLVPKPNTEEAGKFSEIRLWYRDLGDGTGLLPRMARTVTPGDNTVSLIQMINVKTNVPIDPNMLDQGVQGPDWNIDIQPWVAPAR
ncbi:MAG: hypothetical protein JNK25_12500 [Phycisphaerae bacterium]|nr:hypothetical protein [Phycisphaerae bacterium]